MTRDKREWKNGRRKHVVPTPHSGIRGRWWWIVHSSVQLYYLVVTCYSQSRRYRGTNPSPDSEAGLKASTGASRAFQGFHPEHRSRFPVIGQGFLTSVPILEMFTIKLVLVCQLDDKQMPCLMVNCCGFWYLILVMIWQYQTFIPLFLKNCYVSANINLFYIALNE
jgi:hypothetical protein